MGKKSFQILLSVFILSFPFPGFCANTELDTYDKIKARIVAEFDKHVPQQWSETASGVITALPTDKKVIALTLDACGSTKDGYDKDLIDYLIGHNIKATLFINARWIVKNPETFQKLAANHLFDIANHGWEHKPLSVNGKSMYDITGTKSAGEVVDEIEKNARKIELITGTKPLYFRSGTAYYDEVAVAIANKLGYKVIGFNVLGDKGASYSKAQVKEAFLKSLPGSIIICHMNHPEKETAEGVKEAIPELRKKGFKFVKLSEYIK